jgi:hypothetical protein
MVESGRVSEDLNADKNAGSKDCAHEVLGRNESSIGN